MTRRRTRLTAEETHRELADAPDRFLREREEQLQTERAKKQYEKAARPVLSELADTGIDVKAIADVTAREEYRRAVPVLVRWLGETGDFHVEQDLVRSLAEHAARPDAIRPLVKYFEDLDPEADEGLKWAVGNSLAELADDDVAEDIIRLAEDRSHGSARQMLVVALGKLRSRDAIRAARQLLDDDEVAGHAVIALGLARDAGARDALERFTDHDQRWVREQAKRALHKIDTA